MSMHSCHADNEALLPHGGHLHAAATCYGITLADWLDLSTGINPDGWPVPAVPPSAWARLPEDDDALETAARDYYGAACVLPVAGSQAAIQALPCLRAPCRVGVLHPGYAEHAHAWRGAGHNVRRVQVEEVNDVVAQVDVLVLIHPNNPTGVCFARDQLLDWHAQLATRGGWLIVDEAFMDVTPQHSLAPFCPRPGLIVLRSLGKFFGLAGARVGFAFTDAPLRAQLQVLLGPWAVAAPSRWVATQALQDRTWQETTRQQLLAGSQRLALLLTRHGLAPHGGCALFQWVHTEQAATHHERLARYGILTRLFDQPASLRFGLPGNESDWRRLDIALADVCRTEPDRVAR